MFRFDAHAYLVSLVGRTIRALTGWPSEVVAVRGDEVLIRTARTKDPDGAPVPIAWVQEAADRLFNEGELSLDAAELNQCSASMGAVLPTLPGVEGRTNPARLRYTPRDGQQGPNHR